MSNEDPQHVLTVSIATAFVFEVSRELRHVYDVLAMGLTWFGAGDLEVFKPERWEGGLTERQAALSMPSRHALRATTLEATRTDPSTGITLAIDMSAVVEFLLKNADHGTESLGRGWPSWVISTWIARPWITPGVRHLPLAIEDGGSVVVEGDGQAVYEVSLNVPESPTMKERTAHVRAGGDWLDDVGGRWANHEERLHVASGVVADVCKAMATARSTDSVKVSLLDGNRNLVVSAESS